MLHFVTAGTARDVMAGYAAALAPGSCLVISKLHAEGEAGDEVLGMYSSGAAPIYNHPSQRSLVSSAASTWCHPG